MPPKKITIKKKGSQQKEEKLVRLGKSDFQRPKYTQTDKLTREDIEYLLEEYEEADIKNIRIGTHVRYFVTKNGKTQFRMGGNLINKNNYPEYVVLSNGKVSWSVNLEGTVFYKKLSIREINKKYENKLNEMKTEYDNKIVEKDVKIEELMNYIRVLKSEIEKLRKGSKN